MRIRVGLYTQEMETAAMILIRSKDDGFRSFEYIRYILPFLVLFFPQVLKLLTCSHFGSRRESEQRSRPLNFYS